MKLTRFVFVVFLAGCILTLVLAGLTQLARLTARAAVAASVSNTAAISPSVVVVVYGGGNYDDAYNGRPFTIGSGNLAAAAPDTTQVIAEASQCDLNKLSPPGYEIRRSFIEYDTSAITQPLVSARLVFTNFQPFVHDGMVGAAAHDLNIYTGTWATTAAIITTPFVASATFHGWYSSTLLAGVDFTSPAIVYPYRVSLSINPAAVVLSGTTRLVFRTSSEYRVGPLPGSCPTDPNGIGNKFTAPLLEVTYATDNLKSYLPIILKGFGG